MTATYEKLHPDMAMCFKRRDGSVVLIVFQDDRRIDWLMVSHGSKGVAGAPPPTGTRQADQGAGNVGKRTGGRAWA